LLFNWFIIQIKIFFFLIYILFVKLCLQVLLCRRFQITLLRVLKDHNLNNLKELLDGDCSGDNIEIDYLLLPATGKDQRPLIDWECITSVHFSCEKFFESHLNCSLPKGYARCVQTKDGSVCTCMLRNSLVYTPHSGHVYCITGILGLNGNSLLKLRDGRMVTYKKYYEDRYVIIINC
jgi:endoribonuclease Dicer